MPTYLVLNFHTPLDMEIQEITWKAPRIINDWWFGDSGTNARSLGDVFPNTPTARAELEKVCLLYKAAREALNTASLARHEVINKKSRGELA